MAKKKDNRLEVQKDDEIVINDVEVLDVHVKDNADDIDNKKVEEAKKECSVNTDTTIKKEKETVETVKCEVVNDIPNEEEEVVPDEDNARDTIRDVLSFISSGMLDFQLDKQSEETGVSKKRLAKSFFSKFLGTISDVLHVVFDTIEDVSKAIINVLSFVLENGISIICKIAKRIVSVFTLNMTCAN